MMVSISRCREKSFWQPRKSLPKNSKPSQTPRERWVFVILVSHFRFQSTRWSNNLQTFHVFLCHNIIIQMSLASVGNGNEGTRRRFIPPVINQDFAMPVNWEAFFSFFCLIFDLVVFYVPSNSSRCDLNPAKINVFLSSFVNGDQSSFFGTQCGLQHNCASRIYTTRDRAGRTPSSITFHSGLLL